MILKGIDDKTPAIAELERLLATASGGTRPKIEQELRTLRAGIKGEEESAYLIDFDFRDRKNSIGGRHGGRSSFDSLGTSRGNVARSTV